MKSESVIKYYVLNNKLKNIIRQGWKNWNVNRDRVESVAEHIYGTTALALAMYSEYEYEIDIYKVIMMLCVHELEEIIIGDLTAWDIDRKEKEKIGHDAIKKILSELNIGNDIENLILEFDKRESKEAIFAYHIDKLECDIQCKLYDEENCVDLTNQDKNEVSIKDKRVQQLLSGNMSWSEMWLEYDKSKYEDDNNFLEVLEYIKNNNILL